MVIDRGGQVNSIRRHPALHAWTYAGSAPSITYRSAALLSFIANALLGFAQVASSSNSVGPRSRKGVDSNWTLLAIRLTGEVHELVELPSL